MTVHFVEADLQYVVPTGDRPVYFASRGGADAELKVEAQFASHRVNIYSARDLQPPASLDLEGFELHPNSSSVADFYAPQEHWQAGYETELEGLILGATGGSAIHIFDHTLRSDSSGVRGERASREPATIIHNDYTEASAAKRIRDLLPESQASLWLAGRFAIVNAWRSIAAPVVSTPLALCDAGTLTEDDLIPSERRAAERIGELELVRWNPGHRWYYYPEMRRDEVLLIKTFDSASDGRATRCVHSAFVNPTASHDAPARESIESRSIVYFG